MTKIAFVSDLHIDTVTAGVERIGEVEAWADKVCAHCVANEVDHLIVCGDIYDPGSTQDPRWSALIIQLAAKFAGAVGGTTAWIAGNHDVVWTSLLYSTLTPLAWAVAAARESNATGPFGDVEVCESPRLVLLEHRSVASKCVHLLALPYVARPAMSGPYEEMVRQEVDLMFDRNGVNGGRSHWPLIVAGHLTIPGVQPGSEADMVCGRDILFPAAQVRDLRPDIVVNGHYHVPQTVRYEGLDIHIVGSPIRVTFGEDDAAPRGYLLAEVG